jgi:hypothetical protein
VGKKGSEQGGSRSDALQRGNSRKEVKWRRLSSSLAPLCAKVAIVGGKKISCLTSGLPVCGHVSWQLSLNDLGALHNLALWSPRRAT